MLTFKERIQEVKARQICPKCGESRRSDCDGQGWLEAIGPCADGSYITSRPCSNANPNYD